MNENIEFINETQIKTLIGFKPKNVQLYQNAFVHKSLNKSLDMKSNETLEFVGDSVISVIVAEYLYVKYPDENEGFLTRVRTKIVSNKGLSKLGNILELNKFILMNEKAMRQKWNENPRILEDAFEALMGAIFLDKGFDTAKKFLTRLIEKHIDFEDIVEDTNYKDMLMKYLQSNGLSLPIYKITHEAGPDHSKRFTIQIVINNKKISEGSGITKKEAEQQSAYRALKSLFIL
uniref:ribonuclease III n=1 Tax=viral metagenome TaxID=1070528 RepID=A0A6C0FAZ4_9ZZZZ|tara:strand:+ start:17945 stop:18643 length:699 start_codon:yes stop_codon:yes gene_type:complete